VRAIGVDVGGTFTDLALGDDARGAARSLTRRAAHIAHRGPAAVEYYRRVRRWQAPNAFCTVTCPPPACTRLMSSMTATPGLL